MNLQTRNAFRFIILKDFTLSRYYVDISCNDIHDSIITSQEFNWNFHFDISSHLCWVYFLENALDGVEKNSKDDWHKEWNYHYLHSYWIDRVAFIKWSEREIENGYFSMERMMMIFNRWRRMEYKSKNTFSSYISIHLFNRNEKFSSEKINIVGLCVLTYLYDGRK